MAAPSSAPPAPRPGRARGARCRDARAAARQWCRSANARCDAGAGSRPRARAGSSPGPRSRSRRASGPNRAKRGSARQQKLQRGSRHARRASERPRARRCAVRGGVTAAVVGIASVQVVVELAATMTASTACRGNPDASLSALGARATRAAAPRADTLRGSLTGSVHRRGATTHAGGSRAHSAAQYWLPRSQSPQMRTCCAQRRQLYSR